MTTNLVPTQPQPTGTPIRVIRGVPVMLDLDVAPVYGTKTGYLTRAVKRHPEVFTDELTFLLAADEEANLRGHEILSSSGHGGRRWPIRAFTEIGSHALAPFLRTPQARAANLHHARAFIALRDNLAAAQLADRDRTIARLTAHDPFCDKVENATSCVDRPDITTHDIWQHIYASQNPTPKIALRIVACLRILGWEMTGETRDGGYGIPEKLLVWRRVGP